jgi:hypothetical protein
MRKSPNSFGLRENVREIITFLHKIKLFYYAASICSCLAQIRKKLREYCHFRKNMHKTEKKFVQICQNLI